MKYIQELLKGMVIGIANILPGISGGVLAISMGVYDKIIHAVTHILKEPKQSIKLLLPYGIGAVTGIICLSMVFEYLFGTYPLQTKLAFLGLIGGGLPALFERVSGGEKETAGGGYLITAVTCLLVVGITIAGGVALSNGAGSGLAAEGAAALTKGDFWIVSMFLTGFLAAGTMVIPGVSGSMIMMMLGVYEPILQTTNACIRAAAAFDIVSLWDNAAVLLPYFIGMAGGVFLFAKIVEHLLIHYEDQMYRVIIGLVFSSPVVILWNMPWKEVEVYQILFGIALCLLGYVAASRLDSEA